MSDVERFIRFCESDFGTAVMDREAASLKQFVDPEDRILDVGAGIGSVVHLYQYRNILVSSSQ